MKHSWFCSTPITQQFPHTVWETLGASFSPNLQHSTQHLNLAMGRVVTLPLLHPKGQIKCGESDAWSGNRLTDLYMGLSQNEECGTGCLPQGSVSRVCFVVCCSGVFRQSRTSQPYLKLVTPKENQPIISVQKGVGKYPRAWLKMPRPPYVNLLTHPDLYSIWKGKYGRWIWIKTYKDNIFLRWRVLGLLPSLKLT